MQSLPRVVSLEEGELRIEPAQECELLRRECVASVQSEETSGQKTLYAKGEQIEIALRYRPFEQSVLKIVLQSSPDGEEQTVLTLDYGKGDLFLDRSRSTVYHDITTEALHAPLTIADHPVQLRIFVDHSAVEIFYDRRMTMSARIFPGGEDSVRNYVNISADVELLEANVYRLA